MSPRELLAAAFRASLSLDRYGEDVAYYPIAGGPAASLRARVQQHVDPRTEGEVEGREDVLRVAFSSDPESVDAAGQPLGGVLRPERGDAICRTGLGDAEDVQYAFRGRVFGRSDHHWELEFVRVEQQRVGTTIR